MAIKPADTTAVPKPTEELPLMTATEDKIEVVESDSEEDLVIEATCFSGKRLVDSLCS